MSRHTRIILLVLLGTSLLSAAALVAWQLRRLARSFYTDGATIREAASSAAARTILWLPPEALPPSVNGPGDEHEPWFADAGRTLYLARRSAGDDADILAAEWSDRDGWMEVRTIDGLNSEADDLGPVLSPDGERLYFSSNRSGSRGGQDLWLVRREGEGWSAAENLGPGVNSEHDEFGPALAPDGRTIYFASNRPLAHDETGRAGDGASAATRANREATDENLFAAPIDGDGFGPAMPLATLNSVHDERSPAISPVGDFLYFASNRPGGAGGFDLYRSRVRGDQLLPPEPLGTAINTEANEVDPAPSLGGFAMHFGSDRGGRGPPPATASTGPKAAANYDLYHTASREVFIEVDTDWARFAAEVLWPALWALLWGLLCLLAVLALLAVLREGRLRQLNLLTRCLLASLLVHFVLMFVFMLWQVGSGMVTAWERAGAVQVSLGASSGGQGLAPQIRGEVAQVELASLPPRFASRAEAPSEIEVPEALVHVDMPMLDPQQIGDRMRSIEPQAAEAPGAPRPPPMVVPSIEPERELVIRTPESAPASEESEAFPAPAARSDPMQASRGSAPALSLRQVVAATPRVHVELDPMAPQVDHAGNLHAARDIAAFAPLPAQQHAMPTPRSRLTPDLAASTFDLLLPEDERQGDSATGEAAASLPRHDELVTRRADAAGRPAVAVTSAVVQVAPGAIEPDVAIQTVQPVIGQVPDAPRGPSGPILPRAHLEPPIGGPALPALREPAAHDERGHPGIEPQPVIEPARPVAVGRVRQWPLAAHGPAIERDASSPDVPMPASGVEVVQAAVDLRPADAPLPSGFRQPREDCRRRQRHPIHTGSARRSTARRWRSAWVEAKPRNGLSTSRFDGSPRTRAPTAGGMPTGSMTPAGSAAARRRSMPTSPQRGWLFSASSEPDTRTTRTANTARWSQAAWNGSARSRAPTAIFAGSRRCTATALPPSRCRRPSA
jgi:hypothetical protein